MNTDSWFVMDTSYFDAKRKLLGLFPDYNIVYTDHNVITLIHNRMTTKIFTSILRPTFTVEHLMTKKLDRCDYVAISNSRALGLGCDLDNVVVEHEFMEVIFKLVN